MSISALSTRDTFFVGENKSADEPGPTSPMTQLLANHTADAQMWMLKQDEILLKLQNEIGASQSSSSSSQQGPTGWAGLVAETGTGNTSSS